MHSLVSADALLNWNQEFHGIPELHGTGAGGAAFFNIGVCDSKLVRRRVGVEGIDRDARVPLRFRVKLRVDQQVGTTNLQGASRHGPFPSDWTKALRYRFSWPCDRAELLVHLDDFLPIEDAPVE